jgi:hypothetical protein
VFVSLAAVSGYWGITLLNWASIPLLMICTAYLIVGLAFATANPRWFCKRPNGTITPVVRLALLPFLGLNDVLLWFIARTSKEHAADHIDACVYLGRRISMRDYLSLFPQGVSGTVDLTAEFVELPALRNGPYLLTPTMDTFEPTLEQLKEAVDFIELHRDPGPVYVHCAMGHGRSATVVAAWLIATKKLTVPEAVAFLKERRPLIGLHAEQMELLHTFSENLSS